MTTKMNVVTRFAGDEDGAVTVDYAVFLGAVVYMGLTVVGDVATGVIALAERTSDELSSGAAYEALSGISENSGFDLGEEDAEESGGDTERDEDDGDEGEDGDDNTGPGNPGNDKDVGRAGENPNGKGGWGSGSKGMSE